MPSTVNIGTLEGLLRWKVDGSELNSSLNEVARKANVSRTQLDKYNKELNHITSSYDRVAASLDPVTANTQKYNKSQVALSSALKIGAVDQKEYNRLLDLARDKYLSASTAQKTFAKSLDSIGSDLSRVGTALSIGVSAPLAIVSGLAVDSGRKFETSFAGVRKTVDGTRQELEKLSQDLRDLAAGKDPIPIDINKLNEVAESAGQLGIARNNILAFTRTMADLGETTNLTALQASESIAQFQNIFGEAGKDVDRFGSTLVALGNAGASTEKAILEMGVRIAGAGKQIGLTQGQVLAIASSLASVGIEAEAGGSAISKTMINMALAVENGGKELSNFASVAGVTSKQFKSVFQNDAAKALELFISGLGSMKESGQSALSVLDQMGITEVRMRDALLRSAGAGKLLTDNLALQSKAWEENNALTEEAKKRYETFDSQLQLTKNKLNDVGITLGTALLPVLRDFLDLAVPIVSAAGSLAKTFSSLPDPIKYIAVGFGGVVIAAGPLLLVTGQLLQSYASLLLIAPKVASTFPLIGRAITLATGPWGLLAIAIGTVTLALSAFISKWKEEMQGQIEQMVSDSNKLGSAFERLRGLKESKSASSSDLQSMSDELAEVSDQIGELGRKQREEIEKSNKKYNDQINLIKESTGKETIQAKQLAKFRDETADKLREQNRTQLQDLETRKKLLIESLKNVETITDKQTDLSGQVEITSKLEEKVANQLRQINQERGIELQKLLDLRGLAQKGLIDSTTRLIGEEKINDAYEYRLSLLKFTTQFGETIGKQLADQERSLKEMARKVKIELTLAMKLDVITIDIKKKFSEMSGISTDKLDAAIANERQIADIESRNRAEFQKTFDDYNALIDEVENNWRESLKTSKQVADEQIALIKATELTVIEKERAIAIVREQYYSDQMSRWTGFLNYLGDTLGGFFSDIAQLANSIQGVNSVAQSLGGWSSVAGAFGGTIAAMAALYAYADALITKHKGEKYGTRSDYNVSAGVDLFGFTSQASKELGHQINAILEGLEDSLRISAEDLASLEIRISNDGKQTQAWVKGVWIGTFSNTNTAIREALLVAMSDPDSKLRGLSPLMAEGLADWTSPDMEGMFQFLSQLREISDLNLSPSVIQLQQSFLEINRLREALNKLDQSSQVVIDAHNDLTAAQKRLYDQTVNSMLGIDTSAADALRSLAGFQKGIGDVAGTFEAGIQSTINAITEQLKALEKAEERSGALGEPEGGGARPKEGGKRKDTDIIRLLSDTVDGVETEKERLQRELEAWTKKLGEVPKALSQQQIDLGIFTAIEDDLRKSGKYSELIVEMERERIKFKYEELRLQLVTLGAWERWAGVWQDLYNQAMANAGKGGLGRGGFGGSDKDSVRDFIKDKKFELSLVGLSDYQKALKELDKQYDDLIKQAGKDKKLKDELLALKEKELRLLEQEQKKSITEKFREFLGLVTPFDKVRKTATDLIKEIQGSPFGDARKAAMIGRVLAETERQLDRMAMEMGANLFSSMLSDMQKFGATEEQMAEARKMQAILEHEMKLASYALTIAQLEAEGRLAPELITKFKEMFTFLRGIDPTKWIGGGTSPEAGDALISSYTSLADQSNELYDILKSVQDKLAEWGRETLSEVLSRAVELTDSFDALMVDINKIKALGPAWDYTLQAQEMFAKLTSKFIDDVLGEFETTGSEIEQRLKAIGEKFTDINLALLHLGASQADLQRAEEARLSAINEALSEYFDSWREFREGQSFESLTGEGQFLSAQAKFREVFASLQSGDLSRIDDVLPLAEQYRQLLRDFTAGEGVRFGEKEISDSLSTLEEIIPGFADILAGGDGEPGSSSSDPLYMETSSMVSAIESSTSAINTGNNLVLIEHRRAIDELKVVNEKLDNLNSTLEGGVINIQGVA